MNQKNSIVIRYHGLLTEGDVNNSTTFSMFYYFNDCPNDKKIIKLQKCTKCIGECYCATIDLDANHFLNFGFFDENGKCELNGEKTFKLEIAPDPISNLMQRYGFEQNINLPVCEEEQGKIFVFENVLRIIKNFFNNMFKKVHSI